MLSESQGRLRSTLAPLSYRWRSKHALPICGAALLPLFAANVLGSQLVPAEAIEKNDVAAVTKAIREGAEVNAFYETGTSLTALIKAADTDSADVAKLLLDNKADVNLRDRWGSTALMHAARHNSATVAALLLQRGADVEAADKAGLTALMFASEAGAYEAAKLLIDHGAKVNGKRDNSGMSPLIRAVKGRSLKVAQLLVENKADVNAGLDSTDKYSGTTPLMYAAGYKSLPIVRLLVEHGADVNFHNKSGESAISVAEKTEMNREVIAFLKEHGAL